MKRNETKRSEICKNLTFKIRNSDQKYGSVSLQNLKNLTKLQKYASKNDGIELYLLGKRSACEKKQILTKHEYYLEFAKIRPKNVHFSDRKSIQLPQKNLKIPENLTYQAASGNAVPKSVLNATRFIKVFQTTKKYGRDTIIEKTSKLPVQFEFLRHVSFSPHRWTINGPSMCRPWENFFGSKLYPWMAHGWTMHGHAWKSMGSQYGNTTDG